MRSLNEFKSWQPRYVEILKNNQKTSSDLPLSLQTCIEKFENTREMLLQQSESEIVKWLKILPQTDAVICNELINLFKDIPTVKTQTAINQDKLLALKAKAQKFK